MDSANPELGKVIDVGNIRANYLDTGEGPPVILVHGSGPGVTGYANWRLLLPRLVPAFRAVAPDIVGFGYTDRPPGFDYTLENWLNFLCGFMDGLGIPQAHFVGNSFGGALSLALAARHPERVGKLVLMGAAGLEFQLTPGLDAVWGYQPSPGAMRGLMQQFAFNQSLVSDAIVESRYQASIRPGYQESYAQLFPAPRQRHIKRLATPEAVVKTLPHETLIIHGREDAIVPLECSLRLHQLIARSELHVFGQCGHWTQVEKHEQFAELVLGFLGRPA